MSAQQDAVTAHAAMVLELMIGGLNRAGAEANVSAYDEVHRAAVLREGATAVLADTAHIHYGSATDYAERHAALPNSMADRSAT